MSWLHSLINSLDTKEIERLKNFSLLGKEKNVLDAHLASAKQEAPSLKDLCKNLDISETHYYKINSILIDKLLHFFAPEDQLGVLNWLRKKELYALLKYEIKTQLKQKHSSDYFLYSFRLLIDLPFKFYDEKLTDLNGKAYLASLEKCSDADRLYVKHHQIFADCNRSAAGKNPLKEFSISESDLLDMEKSLRKQKHYLAQYYCYRTLCNYYIYYKRNPTLSLAYLTKAIQLKDQIAPFFPINIHQFLRLLYADALLGFNETEKAYALYTEVFDEEIKEDMYGYYYHCEQFAIAAILLSKFDKAERLLHKYFDLCIERKNDIYATRGALSFAKLFLSKKEYKKALIYIQLGNSINEKSYYLPFEIQLRVLENMYFILIEEYDFAAQLAKRNTKFIVNQKSPELSKNYRQLFSQLLSLIACIEKKKAPGNAMIEQYKVLEQNFRNVYCHLIEMVHTKLPAPTANRT
jgi:hypothetical protein